MKTPNFTPVQLVVYLQWVVAQAIAFGWITDSRAQLLVSIGSTVIGAAWKIADAIIRHGRSRALAPTPVIPTVPPA